MSNPSHSTPAPLPFQRALNALLDAQWRHELSVEHTSPPQRLAPYSAGLLADVSAMSDKIASGRLIVLHDPAGMDAWDGDFRCVSFVRADIDLEMANDPLLSSVGWTWLTEALDAHGARFCAPSGTVTCVASESFGGLAATPAQAQVEIRASWTPILDSGNGLEQHLAAWQDTLCSAAGLAPLPEGVVALPGRLHGLRQGVR